MERKKKINQAEKKMHTGLAQVLAAQESKAQSPHLDVYMSRKGSWNQEAGTLYRSPRWV